MVFGDPIEENQNLEATKATAYFAPQPKKLKEKKKINLSCNLHFCFDNCDFKFYDLCSDAVLREQFESALTTYYVHIYPAPYYYYILFTKV